MKFGSHSLSRQRIALLHDVIMAAFSFVAALALWLGLDGSHMVGRGCEHAGRKRSGALARLLH